MNHLKAELARIQENYGKQMVEINQCQVLMQAKLASKDRELKRAWAVISEMRGGAGVNNSEASKASKDSRAGKASRGAKRRMSSRVSTEELAVRTPVAPVKNDVFAAKGRNLNDECGAVTSAPTRGQQQTHAISYAESSIDIPTNFDEATMPGICSRQSPIRYAGAAGLDSPSLQL
jgi:hypothetical protein